MKMYKLMIFIYRFKKKKKFEKMMKKYQLYHRIQRNTDPRRQALLSTERTQLSIEIRIFN